jgi:hypothetical protein
MSSPDNFSCPSVFDLPPCVIKKSYLRAGMGNTFMPWLFAFMFLLLHVALLWGRATRWEKIQYLSLAMAAFTIFLTSLTYASSKLTADTVYVWLPWTLSSEIGSMLQVHALIYHKHGPAIMELGIRIYEAIMEFCSRFVPSRYSPPSQAPQTLRNEGNIGMERGNEDESENYDIEMQGTIPY